MRHSHATTSRRRDLGLAAAASVLTMTGCGLSGENALGPAKGRGTIVVGSADFVESQIIAEIYAAALNNAGHKAETDPAIGAREAYIGAIQHNARTALEWNIALDGNGQPELPSSNSCASPPCRGIVTISGNNWSPNQECTSALSPFFFLLSPSLIPLRFISHSSPHPTPLVPLLSSTTAIIPITTFSTFIYALWSLDNCQTH